MPHHMCCQNCYGLLQRMTALERDFRSLLSEFKDWHFGTERGTTRGMCWSTGSPVVRGTVRGDAICGRVGSRQQAELLEQRTVEVHKTGPEGRVDGNTSVSTARDGQWVQIEARPKRRALYSSVVSLSTPGTTARPGILTAKPHTAAHKAQHTTRREHQSYTLQLKNRFEPLHALSEDHRENNTESARSVTQSQHSIKRTAPTADTLLIGDDTINGVTNPKLIVRCEPNITVPELNAKLPAVLAEYTTVKRIIVHVGKNDTLKQESEILKKDFNDLFNTLGSLKIQPFISGAIPAGSTGMFSRLLGLNTWLQKSCRSNGLNFIDNFNLFFGKRDLFRKNGLHTNKRGAKVLTENLIFTVCNLSTPINDDTAASSARADNSVPEPDPGEQQSLDISGNIQFYQLPETPKPQEESMSSTSSSPTSPHLNLPAAMEKLVSAGTRLSLSLSASPQVRRPTPASTSSPMTATSPLQSPRLSPKKGQAPSPPVAPQRKRQAPQPPERQLRSRPQRQQELQTAQLADKVEKN